MGKHRFLSITMLLFSTAIMGCVVHEYDIDMTPRKTGVERVLTLESRSTPVDGNEVARLSKEYQQPQPDNAGPEMQFRHVFAERMPDDVGGFGIYKKFESPCGRSSIYLERFRGQDDLVEELELRKRAVQTIVGWLSEWIQTEAGQARGYPELQKFLTTTFTRDLINLSIYTFATGFCPAPEEQNQIQIPERIVTYLVEHEYLRLDEIPLLTRAVMTDDRSLFSLWMRRCIARKMGIADEAPLPEVLDFITDLEGAMARLADYLRKTPEYQEHHQSNPFDMQGNPHEPLNIIALRLAAAFLPPRNFSSFDAVTVGFHSPVAPLTTNGRWNESSQTIEWEMKVEPKSSPGFHDLPSLCYAVWSDPNAEFQKQHFGKVALQREFLLTYHAWYQSLTGDEQHEWDEFVVGLSPGPLLEGKLRKFRFKSERELESQGRPLGRKPLAEGVVSLIISQLSRT